MISIRVFKGACVNMGITDVYEKYTKDSIFEIMDRYSKGASGTSWKDFKKLVLISKIHENKDIISFYFKTDDGSKLPKHKPGQFLTIKIDTEDIIYKNEIRTYSLSMSPNNEVYRISVKKINGGLISTYLHDKLQVGDKIWAMIPMGLFTLDNLENKNPLVLISGGIGITPLMSMLYDAIGNMNNIYFIQAIQNSSVQTFKGELDYITRNYHGIKNILFYSNPLEDDVLGRDYEFTGRVDKEWIQNNLPLDSEFYFCGPPPFMKGIYKALIDLGVSEDKIHFEFFGPKEDMGS